MSSIDHFEFAGALLRSIRLALLASSTAEEKVAASLTATYSVTNSAA
ncbi:MAG: hypothetical protein WAU53_11915 [Rhodoplanes sp.]